AKPASKSIPLSVMPSAAAVAAAKAPPEEEADEASGTDEPVNYDLPPLSLLNENVTQQTADHGNVQETAQKLVDALARFKISSEVVQVTPGPIVTQYEVRPAPDVKVERIKNLSDTLQMTLAASSLRIEAPIPGKDVVGFEIPNKRRGSVTFGEIVRGEAFQHNTCEIPLLLGKDVSGSDMIVDLAKLPHLLVAGSTGSGKSVCLNSIIIGLLMSRTPKQLRLILVDPKRVEFTPYNNLPHLLVPVVTDPKKVAFGLKWAIVEMERRLKLFQRAGCRNIVAYNNRERKHNPDELFDLPPDEDTLPYIVVIVDEVASLMQLKGVGKEVDFAISKLAALSRAAGIHLILATQRPSVDVITGTIKNNVPGRIAFKVTQTNDSRTILDSPGAETLIGKGDMLYLRNDGQLIRAQGAWLDDNEVARVTEYICAHYQPIYDTGLSETLDKVESQSEADQLNEELEGAKGKKEDEADAHAADANGPDSDEEVMKNAIEVIYRMKRASTTVLQRRLKIGYTKASRIMDMLEERGIVGPQEGSSTREILVDLEPLVAQNSGFDPREAMAMNAEMAAEAEGVPVSPEEAELPGVGEGGEED
ncbi:MAG: DNA translocase FtsK, partial [Kiritimatiellae bacterium]|nr:DNA translocase FtsK [Kiritimatiellia bacterium]